MSKVAEFTENDLACVGSASRQLAARYRNFMEFADIQQELYIWLIQHYDKVVEWREEHHDKTAERYIIKSLKNHGEKICRKEKAIMSGYEPDDEFFYSISMTADILQLYFDPDWMAPSIDVTHNRDKRPPNEGGNLMAMVSDVGQGYESMGEEDQELLYRVYGGHAPVRDVVDAYAVALDISYGAMDKRIRRVVGRLRAKLGGPAQYKDDE